MSLFYILDGYNLTKQLPSLLLKDLRGTREALVRLIERYQPQGSRHNAVTVVFDGQAGVCHLPEPSYVKVIFSQSESADEKIRELVRGSAHKRRVVVVTDDKELQFSIRVLGANVLPAKEFLLKMSDERIKKRFTKPESQKKKEEETKTISKVLEHQITGELEKIWLKNE